MTKNKMIKPIINKIKKDDLAVDKMINKVKEKGIGIRIERNISV
jgi:hypothetical protein